MSANTRVLIVHAKQLTTGKELQECFSRASPRTLMAHANNSKDRETRGMPIASRPKCVDGPRQQLKRQGDLGDACCQQTQVC